MVLSRGFSRADGGIFYANAPTTSEEILPLLRANEFLPSLVGQRLSEACGLRTALTATSARRALMPGVRPVTALPPAWSNVAVVPAADSRTAKWAGSALAVTVTESASIPVVQTLHKNPSCRPPRCRP